MRVDLLSADQLHMIGSDVPCSVCLPLARRAAALHPPPLQDMRVDLLSAEQERDLASMVQDLLQLEALAKELSTTLGRAPSDFEWMEAAGAAPQPDAGPEDVRAAVQLFQGRLQHGRAAKQVRRVWGAMGCGAVQRCAEGCAGALPLFCCSLFCSRTSFV